MLRETSDDRRVATEGETRGRSLKHSMYLIEFAAAAAREPFRWETESDAGVNAC
jgi:hypothetical protein